MVNFPTAATTMQVDETTNRLSLLNGLVKFDGKFANRVQNPVKVPQFLHKLYAILKRIDPMFQLGDKNGKVMAMDAIPSTYDGCKDKFNLQVVPKRDHQHLMFVATFISTKPLGALKRAAMDLLSRNNLYMNRHALDASILDVASIGWILGAHPRFHSPTLQKARMELQMTEWWEQSTEEVQRQWGNLFGTDAKGQLNIPEFFINARSIRARDGTGQSAQENAFLVVAPIKVFKALTDLFKQVFQPSDDEDPDVDTQFIPVQLQRDDADTYYGLVQQQQQYLRNFQNVSIAGVHGDHMENLEVTVTDPDNGDTYETSLEMALTLHSSIQRLDPGSYVVPLGKWNLSTTKEHAEEAKKWIDSVIASIPVTQRCHTNFHDFPTIVRMQASDPVTTPEYSKWNKYKATAATTLNPSEPTPGGSNKNGRRSYSQNPQEPDIPPILEFEHEPLIAGTNSSYAQAATTFISTMSSDKIKGVETDIQSLKNVCGSLQTVCGAIQTDAAKMRQEMRQHMDELTTKLVNDKEAHSNNDTRTTTTAASSTMDTSLLQEILKKLDRSQSTMDQHQATMELHQSSAQTRFDTLEDQQSVFGASLGAVTTTIDEVTISVSGIRAEQEIQRQVSADLLHRINQLEESATSSRTLGSPVRKRRPRSDDAPPQMDNTRRLSNRNESPTRMETDAPPNTSALNDSSQSGWDNHDELLEFEDDDANIMEEIQTQPGPSAGGPASRS
jgi:hypothetical protein